MALPEEEKRIKCLEYSLRVFEIVSKKNKSDVEIATGIIKVAKLLEGYITGKNK